MRSAPRAARDYAHRGTGRRGFADGARIACLIAFTAHLAFGAVDLVFALPSMEPIRPRKSRVIPFGSVKESKRT